MRGKKYKARDKTAVKSSRDGLMEVNLHSREMSSAGSRESENTVRKTAGAVNYQEIRKKRDGVEAGSRKSRRERHSLSGKKKVRHCRKPDSGADVFIQSEKSGCMEESAIPETYGRHGSLMPETDGMERTAVLENGSAGNGLNDVRTDPVFGQDSTAESRDGPADGKKCMETPDGTGNDDACGVETGAADNMSRRDFCENSQIKKLSHDSMHRQPSRHSAQMENARRQSAGNRKKKVLGKNCLYKESVQDILTLPGENQNGAAGVENSADAAGSGNAGLAEKQHCVSVRNMDRPEIRTFGTQKKEPSGQRKRRGLLFEGLDKEEKRDVQPDEKNRRKDTKRKTAKPDGKGQPAWGAAASSENSSGEQERPEKRKGGRLIFEDNDSGMVRGTGMGIVKRSTYSALCLVEESGTVSVDGSIGDDVRTGQETAFRYQKAAAAVSGIRHMMEQHRSSRISRHRQRLNKNRAFRHLETGRAADRAGMENGRTQNPDAGAAENLSGSTRKKKAARRRQQKKGYRRAYQAAARSGGASGWEASGPFRPEIMENIRCSFEKKRRVYSLPAKRNSRMQWVYAAVLLCFLAAASMFASCSMLIQGTSGIIGTTYPGSDEDIRAAEAGYLALESALDSQVNGMESEHPGYDEYRYQIDEISHDPYSLASYLTVICPGFTYSQAEPLLGEILESQYRLTVEERTETRTDPDTGEDYEWRVLCISLTNRGLDAVAHDRLTPEQEDLYKAYNMTLGNRSHLFGESDAGGGNVVEDVPGSSVGISGEALSDQRFANMMHEAEKYLGYPYVWGGSSPQTSFDCSGFVSWVINNCGNGWNVGRQTAEGLRGCCAYVVPEDARPGDLIFFQGTYNTPGASHVGIYIGNNRMIHCGSPVQVTELGQYWRFHFLSYGRLP